MKIKAERIPRSRIKLNIEVDRSEIKPYFEQAYKKLSQQINIKGFREGKAPKLMIIEAAGLNRYNSTALDLALPQVYYQAIQQEKLIPISSPSVKVIQFSEDEDFIFEAEVDLVPEIKLGDYRKLKVKSHPSTTLPRKYSLENTRDRSGQVRVGKLKVKNEVTNEEIEKVVKRLLYQSAQFTTSDAGAKNGDAIEIDFEGSVKGVKREDLVNKNYPLVLGEKVLVPGFEEELVGLKKGEEKEFELKVKGNLINFKVKINNVSLVKLPELNGDFCKKFGHDNPEKLKRAISESILAEKNQNARLQLEQEILTIISEKTDIDIPTSLVEQEISRKISMMQQQMGPIWNQYLEKMGKTIEDLRKEMEPGAEKQVKFGLILGEIAKDMGLLKESPKTKEEQEKVIKETMDKLIEIASK